MKEEVEQKHEGTEVREDEREREIEIWKYRVGASVRHRAGDAKADAYSMYIDRQLDKQTKQTTSF